MNFPHFDETIIWSSHHHRVIIHVHTVDRLHSDITNGHKDKLTSSPITTRIRILTVWSTHDWWKTMNKWIHLVSWALKSHTHFAFSTSHNLTVSSSPATARMEFWKISGGCFYRYAYPSYENASSWGDPLLENWQQHLMLCLCDSTSENVAFTLCQNCSQNLAFG